MYSFLSNIFVIKPFIRYQAINSLLRNIFVIEQYIRYRAILSNIFVITTISYQNTLFIAPLTNSLFEVRLVKKQICFFFTPKRAAAFFLRLALKLVLEINIAVGEGSFLSQVSEIQLLTLDTRTLTSPRRSLSVGRVQ